MIRNKLARKRGFTLTELLITIAILSFLGVAVTTGIAAGGRALGGITLTSEAAVLNGTLAVELSGELRFAETISVQSDGTVLFTSRRHGGNVSVGNEDGRVTVGGSPILSDRAYTGLDANAKVSFENGVFTVLITASSPGGDVLDTITFCVAPISA